MSGTSVPLSVRRRITRHLKRLGADGTRALLVLQAPRHRQDDPDKLLLRHPRRLFSGGLRALEQHGDPHLALARTQNRRRRLTHALGHRRALAQKRKRFLAIEVAEIDSLPDHARQAPPDRLELRPRAHHRLAGIERLACEIDHPLAREAREPVRRRQIGRHPLRDEARGRPLLADPARHRGRLIGVGGTRLAAPTTRLPGRRTLRRRLRPRRPGTRPTLVRLFRARSSAGRLSGWSNGLVAISERHGTWPPSTRSLASSAGRSDRPARPPAAAPARLPPPGAARAPDAPRAVGALPCPSSMPRPR